jgi:hypothetical protein
LRVLDGQTLRASARASCWSAPPTSTAMADARRAHTPLAAGACARQALADQVLIALGTVPAIGEPRHRRDRLDAPRPQAALRRG